MTVESIRRVLLALNIGIASIRSYILVGLALSIWLFSQLLDERREALPVGNEKEPL